MASDYERILQDNLRKYGERVSEYGKLFIELYSDKTHFVYELLQNAEDAIARRARTAGDRQFAKRVRFHLFPDRLEFRHNGALFNLADVVGVCGLGEGTKPVDLTQIGKFGIGFKSVYAYTASPEIHSGDEHFRIQNFVHPEAADTVPTDPDETLFIFPFNKPGVPAEKSFVDVAHRLKELGLHTLLFLPQTEEIVWTIDGETSGQYLRDSQPCGSGRRIELVGQANGAEEYEAWLVFDRRLEPEPQSLHKVEVAYRYGDEQANEQQLVAYHHATLAAFFPTAKETHLDFLIQGPYRTTPARDNIPLDEEWNRRLIQETALLVADTLPLVRDQGLLDVNFLQALPINPPAFGASSPFRPIYLAVREALITQRLLPAATGGHVPAKGAKLARGSALRQLLSEEQLIALKSNYLAALKNEPRSFIWLSDEITADRTPQLRVYCLQELGIEEITPEDFARQFNESFVVQQSDDWLIAFYRFLSSQPALWRDGGTMSRSAGPLRNKPFIRLENGRHVPPYDAKGLPNAYLPTLQLSEFSTVKQTITTDPEAAEFLRELGLTTPDLVDEVLKFILPKYSEGKTTLPSGQTPQPLLEEHQAHVRKIFDALEAAPHGMRQKLIEEVKTKPILVARNAVNEVMALRCPADIYFPTEELQAYFRNNPTIWFLAEQCPNAITEEDFRSMLQTLGVALRPWLIKFRPDFSREELTALRDGSGITIEKTLVDFRLEGLEFYLDQLLAAPPDEQESRSLLLWNILLGLEDNQEAFSGHYSWQYYSQRHKQFDAAFLKLLHQRAWLPGHNRSLNQPAEVTLDDLPESFPKHEWLATRLLMRPPAVIQLARETGIKAEDLTLILAHPDDLAALIQRLREQPTPSPAPSAVTFETEPNPEKDSTTADQNDTIHQTDHQSKQGETGNQATDSGEYAKQSRLLTYVAPPGSRAVSTADRSEEIARRHQRASQAVERVLKYERDHQRVPEEMPTNNEGFDVRSVDPGNGQTRYIEVKATHNEWGAQGVGLTHPEFAKGEQLGENYWLYVVDRVDSADPHIYLIPDPVRRVQEFFYDAGWRGLAIEENDQPDIGPELEIY